MNAGSDTITKPGPQRASPLQIYIAVLFTFMTMAVVGMFIIMAVTLGIVAVPLKNLFFYDGYDYYLRVSSV